jgi:hypothetical protein
MTIDDAYLPANSLGIITMDSKEKVSWILIVRYFPYFFYRHWEDKGSLHGLIGAISGRTFFRCYGNSQLVSVIW